MMDKPVITKAYRHVIAHKGKRFLAFLIDVGLLVGLILLVRQPFIDWMAKLFQVTLEHSTPEEMFAVERFYQGVDAILGLPMVILVYLVPPLYFKNGQTIGKRILGLALIQKNGDPPRLIHLMKRSLIGFWLFTYVFSILVYFATFFMTVAFFIANRQGKAIHDIIGGTIVVEKEPILVDIVEKPIEPLPEVEVFVEEDNQVAEDEKINT